MTSAASADGRLAGDQALIFDNPFVPWNVIGKMAPFRRPVWPSLRPFPLRSFPLPGRMEPASLEGVEREAEGIRFPGPGRYYLLADFGVAKVLILDPSADRAAWAVEVVTFLAECSWHSSVDTRLCFEDSINVFRPNRAIEKLFFSDQPLGLKCGHLTDLSAWLLAHMGFEVRRINLLNDARVGHVFLEARPSASDSWMMLDPDFGVVVRLDGRILDAHDIKAARDAGDESLEIDFLVNKGLPRPGLNFPANFHGQYSWKPEDVYHSQERTLLQYRQMVIGQGYEGLRYSRYIKSPPADDCLIWRPVI